MKRSELSDAGTDPRCKQVYVVARNSKDEVPPLSSTHTKHPEPGGGEEHHHHHHHMPRSSTSPALMAHAAASDGIKLPLKCEQVVVGVCAMNRKVM